VSATATPGYRLTPEDVALVERHRADMAFAAYDLLGWLPTYDKQAEVLRSVQENPETHVVSANGVGKTDLAAVIVDVWMLTRRGIVITTANTWTQVKTVLWERMRKIASQAPEPLGLEFNETGVKLGDQWFAMGLSTKDQDRFAGYHEAEQLVVVEEASGIEAGILDAIDGILVGERDRLLMIGNPLTRECPWYGRVRQVERENPEAVIHISAFDTPNVQTGREIVPGMVTREKVERNIARWGEDDPRTYARVYGLWPPTGGAGLYPIEWLERAYEYSGPPLPGRRKAGADIARYGDDQNALAYFDGGHLVGLWEWGGVSTAKTSGRLVRVMDGKHPDAASDERIGRPDVLRIDSEGVGGGVYDNVEEARKETFERQKVALEEWRAGAATSDPDEFAYFKDEAHWYLRVLLENNQLDLSALSSEQREEVTRQALAIGYDVDRKGRKVVHDKKTVKKALGRSPDLLEAIIQAAWEDYPYEPDEDLAASLDELAAEEERTALLTGSGYYGDSDDFYDPAGDL